jgi:acetyl esterase
MEVGHPKLLAVNHFPFWYRAYLKLIAIGLSNIIWLVVKDPGLFDFEEKIPTPGLGGGQCLVRIFLPQSGKISNKSSPNARLPVIIHLEGGGFVMGSPAGSSYNLRKLADEIHAIVISLDYAKSPAFPFPHALLQVPYIISWACERLNASPSHVAIGGNSSGGNISASFSLLSSFKHLREVNGSPLEKLPADFKLRTQFLINASVHQDASYAVRRDDSRTKEALRKSLPVWAACAMEDAYLPPPIDRKSPFVAPGMISTSTLKALVQASLFPQRALVITAEWDCLSVEGGRYAEKLRDAGVEVEIKEFQGATHTFDHAEGWDGKGAGEESHMAREAWSMISNHLRHTFEDD